MVMCLAWATSLTLDGPVSVDFDTPYFFSIAVNILSMVTVRFDEHLAHVEGALSSLA